MTKKSQKLIAIARSTGKRLKLGSYRPDKEDPNDKKYAADRYSSEELPSRVDLRQHMSAVEDQGEVGSCTANAMAGAYEYLAKRTLGYSGDVSRLFVYYNARALEAEHKKDVGTSLRNCIQVLRVMGTCAEEIWPYDPETLNERPSSEAYEDAARFLIEDAQRINIDLDAMKHCLAEGYPFAFGLVLFESFMKSRQGRIPMPDLENEQFLGGHAMLCVGYSDQSQVFVARNSWGSDWGDKGYCYIPYDYIANPQYCADCWTIRKVTDLDFTSDIWYEDEEGFYEEDCEDEEDYEDDYDYEDEEDYDEDYDEEYYEEDYDEDEEDYGEDEENYDEDEENYDEDEENYDEDEEDYDEDEENYDEDEEDYDEDEEDYDEDEEDYDEDEEDYDEDEEDYDEDEEDYDEDEED
ncbi:MAG: C1 family peptidase [Oscillatoria sp. SIO1A7]|nr:C1 family peptidase [Oscillatoria sp. SIO1A7]